jgi:hypothetical protein
MAAPQVIMRCNGPWYYMDLKHYHACSGYVPLLQAVTGAALEGASPASLHYL